MTTDMMKVNTLVTIPMAATAGSLAGALILYGAQLVFNFFWTLIFFNLQNYALAFFWLLALWVLVFTTAVLFFRISRPAGWLLAPYLVWITFAGYLNFGVYLLN